TATIAIGLGASIVAVLISIITKECMFRYKFRLGQQLKSDALIVNAYEHRSDVYSSLAALVGIGAAVVGDFLQIGWLEYADPVAGLVVALMILRIAWTLGKESIGNALDRVMNDEDSTTFLSSTVSSSFM
ncbi:cation transporter, partial [Robertmurraya sp. DFI.2.37]|uniref:cation diffusion facilitator family transporter n=1 Tax=Robertmurraya sp. DFI.2.37 TaxID=3031819 RepID=UPI0023D97ECB